MLPFLPQWCCLWQCGLPEGFLTDQPETTAPGSDPPASTDSPVKEVATEEIILAEKVTAEEVASIWRPPEGPSTSQTLSGGPARREHLPFNSLGGGKCYIPPGQSLPLGRSLWSPTNPDGDLIVRVLGKGGPSTDGWRNNCRSNLQGQSPHHQLGHWKLCMACDTTSGLPGSNVLSEEGPIASGCSWGTTRTPCSWQQWWSPLWQWWAPAASWRMRPPG